MASKALVVLSGGQDSTLCLHWALQQDFDEVQAIAFNYGQTHAVEIDSARYQCEETGVKLEVVDLGPILKGTSPLTNSDEVLEQYEDGVLPGGIEKTFVPMRNQLFITVAANRAYCMRATNLVLGVCQADSGGYPDCRQTFIDAIMGAISSGTFTGEIETLPPLYIHTPLMNLTKAESIKMAMRIEGAYAALAYTHTAYDGAYPPLGADHANVLRAKGFEEAGVPDPLILRAVQDKLIDLPDKRNYDVARVDKRKKAKKYFNLVEHVAREIGAA